MVYPIYFLFNNQISKKFIVIIFICCSCNHATGADTANVQILNANALTIVKAEGKDVKKLIGDVHLQHGETTMLCDSAIIDDLNNVDAKGHVRINKAPNVTITGNSLYYQSKEKFATMRGNVRLNDSKMLLQTNELFYDMNLDAGYYINNGMVTSDDTKIRSLKGIYYSKKRDVFFKDDVIMTNPKFKFKSDTLKYNLDTKIATFYGSTQIYNDSSTIWCKSGWYNTNTDISAFGANTLIVRMPQWLRTDSLYYERNTGFGRVFKNFDYHDTSLHITLEGTTADYFERQNRVIGYNRPLLTYEQDADNVLYIRADTLITKEVNGFKSFYGYKKVRMFKKDFQAVCDTIIYSLQDSILRMHNKPILWNDSTQLMADTIYLYNKNNKPYKAELLQKAMLSEHIMVYAFNQIAGQYIHIFFKNGKIDFLHALKDTKSKYYGKEEGKGYQGMNTSESDEIKTYFKAGKISRIQFIGMPKAYFTPMKKLNSKEHYLLNFVWKSELRPINQNDL